MNNLVTMDKQYKTRSGRDVRILCTDNTEGGAYYVVAIIEGYVHKYTSNGRYYSDEDESEFDLVEVTEEKELWLEVYRYKHWLAENPDQFCTHASLEELQSSIDPKYRNKDYQLIATKKITYVEGERCE